MAARRIWSRHLNNKSLQMFERKRAARRRTISV
jgi:hypothetical protein